MSTAACFFLGLLAFGAGCGLVRKWRNRSRVWWELNRWRAALALEEDPGPWTQPKVPS